MIFKYTTSPTFTLMGVVTAGPHQYLDVVGAVWAKSSVLTVQQCLLL